MGESTSVALTFRDGLPLCSWSPIQVLYRNLEQDVIANTGDHITCPAR